MEELTHNQYPEILKIASLNNEMNNKTVRCSIVSTFGTVVLLTMVAQGQVTSKHCV